jgi:hypothetical protein
MWSEDLAEGTLLDGEMVKDTDGKWVFLVNDMSAYKGRMLMGEHLPERLRLIRMVLQKQYVPNNVLDVCKYEVKRYVHATQQGVKALIEWSAELKYSNRGVYFWPFNPKYKPKLYNFDESLIKTVHVKVKDNPEFRVDPQSPEVLASSPKSPPKSPSTPPKTSISPGEKVFWLRKTEYPDVYDMYPTDNGMLHNNKVGIAYVKTLEDSKMLRSVFKTATVAVYVPFRCIMENDKWKPVEQCV